MSDLCSEATLQQLVEMMQSGTGNDVARIDAVLLEHPKDPRLHFLRGSVLVGEGKHIAAYGALQRAIEIAPDFSIARFQLGFFQLTSGEAENALATWEALRALPDDHYLKVFVQGLTHLIRDEFVQCVECLQKGQALNSENPPLNSDMNLIVEQCEPLIEAAQEPHEEAEVSSATSMLLNQYTDKGLKH